MYRPRTMGMRQLNSNPLAEAEYQVQAIATQAAAQAAQMTQVSQAVQMDQNGYQALFADTAIGMVGNIQGEQQFSASSWLSTMLARVPIFHLMGLLEAAQDSTDNVLRHSMATRSPLHAIIMFPMFYAAATASTKTKVLERTYADLQKVLDNEQRHFACMESLEIFKTEFDSVVRCMFGHDSLDSRGIVDKVVSLFDTESFKLKIALENFTVQQFLDALTTAGYKTLGTTMGAATDLIEEKKGGADIAITLISTVKEKVEFKTPLKLIEGDGDAQDYWQCLLSEPLCLEQEKHSALQAQGTAHLVDIVHGRSPVGTVVITKVRVPVVKSLDKANCQLPETEINPGLYNVFMGGQIGPVTVQIIQVKIETKGYLNKKGAQAEQTQKVRMCIPMGVSQGPPKPPEFVLVFNNNVPLNLLFPGLGLALTVRTDSTSPISAADLAPNPAKQGFSFPIFTNRTVAGKPVTVTFLMGPRPSAYSLYLTYLKQLWQQQGLNVQFVGALEAREQAAISAVKASTSPEASKVAIVGTLTHTSLDGTLVAQQEASAVSATETTSTSVPALNPATYDSDDDMGVTSSVSAVISEPDEEMAPTLYEQFNTVYTAYASLQSALNVPAKGRGEFYKINDNDGQVNWAASLQALRVAVMPSTTVPAAATTTTTTAAPPAAAILTTMPTTFFDTTGREFVPLASGGRFFLSASPADALSQRFGDMYSRYKQRAAEAAKPREAFECVGAGDKVDWLRSMEKLSAALDKLPNHTEYTRPENVFGP